MSYKKNTFQLRSCFFLLGSRMQFVINNFTINFRDDMHADCLLYTLKLDLLLIL